LYLIIEFEPGGGFLFYFILFYFYLCFIILFYLSLLLFYFKTLKNYKDLSILLKKIYAFEETIAKQYIAEILLGIEFLHKLNIIHRDIKVFIYIYILYF
jgi:serine/threonine protein kinase